MDGAIALDQADDAVGADDRLREIALLVLDDRQLAGAIGERCIGREAVGEPLADSLARASSALLEHVVDQPLAADRPDRRQQAIGQAVVVGREQILGGVGDVVDVAGPADTVAHGSAADQAGRLERVELLEHPGPARAEAGRQILGCRRSVLAEAQQQVATKSRRSRPCRRRGRAAARSPARLGDGGASGALGALRGSGMVREG